MLRELLLVVFLGVCGSLRIRRPNIVLILADDLGWNDVSFHGSPQIPTPNIDALAASGIILNRFYTAPQCTPSRASLMTGRYPTNTGLQHSVLIPGQPAGLPLDFTIMPQHMKRLGYATHMIGKWHLGYYKKEYTPTYRGFDSFYGYWNGQLDFFDYTYYENETSWGIDLHDGLKPIKDVRGEYAPDHFAQKAVEIIRSHDKCQPLFLYFAHPSPHSGNLFQPLQTTPEYAKKVAHIKDLKRRNFGGEVSALDASVGKVFAALAANHMLQNSIILFVSDNGGEIEGMRGGCGSNWPLRGAKAHTWEGGVRVPAVLWSPLLNLKKPRVSKHMMHVSDVLPTFYSAAGGNVADLGSIDGIDMWKSLVKNLPSRRTEILLTADPYYKMSALMYHDYKVVVNTMPIYNLNLWYADYGKDLHPHSMDEWVWKNGSIVRDILKKTRRWLIKEPDTWRQNAAIVCSPRNPADGACDPTLNPCLFNIIEDPCEYHDLASEKPEVVQKMLNRIKELNSTSISPLFPPVDPRSDPRCYGFVYVPWLEEKYQSVFCELSTGYTPF